MPTIYITIPGTPHAQKRHRSRVITARGRAFVSTYKDAGQQTAEDNFRAWIYQKAPAERITGPVCLGVTCYFPVPASWSKKRKADALTFEMGMVITKPDLDNLLKHICDCMTDIFWVDDKQIYSATIQKWYAEKPRTEIEVSWL